MTTTASLRSGDSAVLASPTLTPMLICCASGGVVGQRYTFDPGDDVSASIGGGIGADEAYALLRQGQRRIRVTLAASTWGALPTVAQSGGGPAVTVALAPGALGPFDDFKIVFTVTRGGIGGEGAEFSAAYDGSTVIETLPIPAEVPAVLDGSIDITTGAPVGGLTLVFSAPSADTITFSSSSLVGAVAGLKAATATSASPVVLVPADLLAPGLSVLAAHPRRIAFTTAGVTPSDAPANVVITGKLRGVVVTETLVLAQTATTVASAKAYDEITSLAYAAGDGTGATIAIGYSQGSADADEIVDDFNALAAVALLDVRARAKQSSSGATYFELYSTAAGPGVVVTIDTATSTADSVLGFVASTNDSATGAAATFTAPWTGLTHTWPTSSAYVLGTTYTTICQGPRASLGAIVAAAQAAHDDYDNNPFGFIVVGQPSDTATNCAALEVSLAGLASTWLTDGSAPIAIVVGAPFFTASATLATNNVNIQTADAQLLLAFQTTAANFGNVATCDVYLPGSPSLRAGSYRRTAAIAWAAKHAAAAKFAADVADGLCPEAVLLAPDLVTRARNDSTATTKLGRGQGPGYSALMATKAGLNFVKFVPGATRAGPTSRLRYIGPLTVGLEIVRVVFPTAEEWAGQVVLVDPFTNQMSDDEKNERKSIVDTLIRPTLLPKTAPPNVSDYAIVLGDPTSGTFLDNGGVLLEVKYKPLGEIEDVTIKVTGTGATISTPT